MSKKADYLSRAKALKKIGALPKGYSTAKTHAYTDSEKRHIRRLWQNFNEIATAPDRFFVRDVSARTGRLAKESGLATYKSKGSKKSKIYVAKDYYQSIEIKNNQIILGVEEQKVSKRRTILLTPRKNVLDRIQYLMETKPLKKYEYVQARIGNNAPFHTLYDYGDFLNYMTAWQPKDEKWQGRKDELLTQLSIASVVMRPADLNIPFGVIDPRLDTPKRFKPRRGRRIH